MPDLRRTLDELAARYKLDVTIGREVYVEGVQDKVVLEHLARRWTLNVPIYTANTIYVDHQELRDRGLEFPSARSALIAARVGLEDRGVEAARHVFLVDRDLEDLVVTPWIEGCVLTDHGCLLASLLNEHLLDRLVNVVSRGIIDAAVFWSSICEISKYLYAIRIVAREERFPLPILSQSGFIRGSNVSGFHLRLQDYVFACTKSGGLVIDAEQFVSLVTARKTAIDRLIDDPRVLINDHDLWVIIRTILRECGDCVNRSVEDIRDLVLMGIDARSFEGGALEVALRG